MENPLNGHVVKPKKHRGLFISFEGGDGAGKSTQIFRLSMWLKKLGYSVVLTREPGGTDIGAELRRIVLTGGYVDARAEALIYAGDRAQHVTELIMPALTEGKIVLVDRYLDSSIAYQGAARDLGKEEIFNLSLWATDGLMPDATFLLDVSVATGMKRVGDQGDRIEVAGQRFHERVRQEYLELADDYPERIQVINAERHPDDVEQEIRATVETLLEQFKDRVTKSSDPIAELGEAAVQQIRAREAREKAQAEQRAQAEQEAQAEEETQTEQDELDEQGTQDQK